MFTPKRKKKLKEIKDLNKGKRMICLWIRRKDMLRHFPKIIYKFKVTLNKTQLASLQKLKHSKIHMEIMDPE